MQIDIFTHPLATVLQLLAVIWALRLIPLTGKAVAWWVFSAAFMLTGAHRLIELLAHYEIIQNTILSHNLNSALALIISILTLLGIYLIREIFVGRAQAQQKLHQQLDELQRFQRLTVGRELRMKYLAEENAALRDQLAGANPDKDRP